MKRIKVILKIFIYDEIIFIISNTIVLSYKTYAMVWLKKGNATFFISFFIFTFFTLLYFNPILYFFSLIYSPKTETHTGAIGEKMRSVKFFFNFSLFL